jgi:antitoxin (DNA-binding transcriptional repressor) of toxin-antitoxin stability system
MITANINDIKTNLSYYVNLALKDGEKIIICNRNSPVAEIKAISPIKKVKKKLGVCSDKIVLSKNFNETSEDIINSFYHKK